jgi:prepilin-type N-terminal cleavage/methylation domain-containing protein
MELDKDMSSSKHQATIEIGLHRRSTGMTLIEMMLAMAISSVLLLGSFTIYTQTRSSYRTTESVAHLQENVRFAVDTLAHDIQLAQFWGRTNVTGFSRTADVQIICDDIDVTNWALDSDALSGVDMVTGVEATDDTYDLDCPGTDPRNASDVLVIRHASSEPVVAPVDGQVQIQSNGEGGRIFASAVAPTEYADNGSIHDVIVNAYYVSNQSKYDGSLPALRRRSLAGETMQDQEIIPGVENLQVQFGIDTTDDGEVNGYVDSDHFMIGTPNVQIRSVRLWLLVRSEMTERGQGYQDKKTYSTPDADMPDITPASDENYPAEFRRTSITKTIFLRNM